MNSIIIQNVLNVTSAYKVKKIQLYNIKKLAIWLHFSSLKIITIRMYIYNNEAPARQ